MGSSSRPLGCSKHAGVMAGVLLPEKPMATLTFSQRPVRGRHAILAVLVVAALAVSAAFAMQARPASAPARYRIDTVSRGPVTGVLEAPAVLEPTVTVRIGTEASGTIRSIEASVGDRVK